MDNSGDEIVGFFGNAAGQDMECPAMMEERPWKEDIDTFGLCACAHVLLWGTHIKVVKDVKDKWRQEKNIRRYWCKDLWHEFFSTLLNSGGDDEDGVGVGFGSGHEDLRRLREGFEGHMEGRKRELKALLSHFHNLVKGF